MQDFNLYPKDPEDRAYKEGQEARERDEPVTENPYFAGSGLAEEWRVGWDDRDYDLEEEKGS